MDPNSTDRDEVIEAYVERYRLNDPEINNSSRKKILNLTAAFRETTRLRFADCAEALRVVENLRRRAVEVQVFHSGNQHEGVAELLKFINSQLDLLPERILKKFSA